MKDKRAAGIPQRGQIDSLDWSNFDEYMQVCDAQYVMLSSKMHITILNQINVAASPG